VRGHQENVEGKIGENMQKNLVVIAMALGAASAVAFAQDANALLQKASIAMGATNLNSLQYSGTGHISSLGQNRLPDTAWPETTLPAYTRIVDYTNKSSREELTRIQNTPPSKGGGAPFAGEQKQVNMVSGPYAWNQPGPQAQPQPAAADERQLQIWLTPHGFLKGALDAHATMKKSKGGTQVTFTALSKYKIVGTIDERGMVTKVETWVANPVLGDMPVETLYTDYKEFGTVKFPTKIVQNQGGHPLFDLTVTEVKANPGPLSLAVTDAVRNAKVPPATVETVKLGEGAWWLGGGTHHSVVVEFKDYIVVVETPLTDERAEAVLAEAKKLAPNRPIKYVVNTHHHFDHSGGLRAVVAEGIPIITDEQNKPFYEKVWKNPHTLEPDMLSKKPRKATFIVVKDKYVITDGTQSLELYVTTNNDHNGDMMIGYLPKLKVLIEADLFTPGPANAPVPPVSMTFANQLYDNIQRLKLEPVTVAPLHGRVAPYSEMLKMIGKT
jgi:glyoxylase-like metal-dependent hydrolase (beta-lactamase superfamily II)